MKRGEIVPLVQRVLNLDSETPRNYDHRWINLHGLNAVTGALNGGTAGKDALSVPESKWPDLLRGLQGDFLKGAERTAATGRGDVQSQAAHLGRYANFTRFADVRATALTAAAIRGDLHEVDTLIEEGADPNALSTKGIPVLGCVLLYHGKPGFVALLEHHAIPGAAVGVYRSPLGDSVPAMAALSDDSFWLEQLLAHGLSPDFVTEREGGLTLIFETISVDRDEMTALLIRSGADLNHRTTWGDTPLTFSAGRGWVFHFESTLMLLDGGADWRLTNKQGKGLIDYLLVIAKRMPPDGPSDHSSAWWKNYRAVVRWLSSHGAPLPEEIRRSMD
jgi:hypothetical protein